MRFTHSFRYFSCIAFVVLLSACQQQPSGSPPATKVGKPYAVNGKMYYPAYDPTYDKIGMASWYGPGFHGKYTANGELFDQDDLTAAHPTLPMPSLVRVTNLANGKSLIVRVNDRGPFKSNRIIDLSKKAAQRLEIHSLAQVRVQYLRKETEDYLAGLQSQDYKPIDMAKINEDAEKAKDIAVVQSTEPQGQIVEATDASTHTGDTISSAAPIMTVSSTDTTPAPAAAAVPAVHTEEAPAPKVSLVKEVWADDNVTLPEPPKEAAAESAPAEAPVATQAEAAPTPQAEEKQSIEEKQPETQAAEKAPETLAPSAKPAKGNFMIQAGSFASEENAHKLSTKLQGVASIAIDKIEMGEKTWWRVRLGPFSEKSDADSALSQTRANGVPDARIIRL